MRVAGKGNLDHMAQLWQLQNSSPAADRMPGKVDRYKQFATTKDEVEMTRTAMHQEKHKRSGVNAQARTTSSLHHRKQEKGRTGPLTLGSMPDRQAGTQNAASYTSTVPLQPLSKYRQLAQSDQAAEMASSIVVTG